MIGWGDVLGIAFPGMVWTLGDVNDLNTLTIAKDGVHFPATARQKQEIRERAVEVEPIILARRARRAKVKQMMQEFHEDLIYEALLDDVKLAALRDRVRQIDGA